MRRVFFTRLTVELVHYLDGTGRSVQARWMRASCFKGSGRWLRSHFFGRLAFRSGNEYRVGRHCTCAFYSHLRLRTWRCVRCPLLCSCGLLDPADEPLHCLDCQDSQWHHIQRHNLVRDLLFRLLVKHLRTDRVVLEASFGARHGQWSAHYT